MERTEAMELARKLSDGTRRLAVIFDKEFDDFFVSEGDSFKLDENFYKPSPYEVVATF